MSEEHPCLALYEMKIGFLMVYVQCRMRPIATLTWVASGVCCIWFWLIKFYA